MKRNVRLKIIYFLFLLAFSLTSACDTNEIDLPSVSWEGENVLFATSSDLPCESALLKLDQTIQNVADYMETSLDQKIEYYVLDIEYIKQLCGDNAAACAYDRIVYATKIIDIHELGHAIGGMGHSDLFDEGFVSAIDIETSLDSFLFLPDGWDSIRSGPSSVDMANIVSEIVDNQLELSSPNEYGAAAVFASYLLNGWGKENVLRVFDSSSEEWTRSDFNQHFTQELGESFDSVIDTFANDNEFCNETALCPNITMFWSTDGVGTDEIPLGYTLCSNESTGTTVNTVVVQDESVFEITQRGMYFVCILEPGQTDCDLIPYLDPTAEIAQGDRSYMDFIFENKGGFEIKRICEFGPGCLRDYYPSPHSQFGYYFDDIPIGKQALVQLSPGKYSLGGTLKIEGYSSNDTISVRLEQCVEGAPVSESECESSRNSSCDSGCRACFYDSDNDCKMCDCVEF